MRTPVPILLYHSISDQASPKFARWVVSPELFESHITYLDEAGYQSVTVTEFATQLKNGNFDAQQKYVLITFDDGFADFYSHALPVLDKYGMKATVYITTKYVGGSSLWLQHEGERNRKMLSWDQIRSMNDNGIECGSHGHSHQQMDIIPFTEAQQEIAQSKEALEDQLSRPIYTFAYPHGYHSETIKTMVQQAGYTSACAVKQALSSSEDDPFALARIIISPFTGINRFLSMLEGKNLPVSPYPERMRTKAWRGMRWLYGHFSDRAT